MSFLTPPTYGVQGNHIVLVKDIYKPTGLVDLQNFLITHGNV